MYSHPCEPMGQAALTHFIRLFYSWNFVMSQRTVEQPELKDLPCTGVFFLIAGIFFFQVHVDKHLSRQYSLKCGREHAKAAGVDIIPTNQSVRNKQERGPHDVQTQR